MRVWITRAEPGASRTADRLRALGHEPLVAPLLAVRPIRQPEPDLAGVAALAFTSANGVAAFAALSPRRDLPVFAVGDATAVAARQAGFVDFHSADGDVDALAQLIAADRETFPGEVLHPCVREPAGDLVGQLEGAGVPARALPVYATESVAALPKAAAAVLKTGGLDAVLIHSPKAAEALSRLTQAAGALRAIPIYGLSPACLAPLAHGGFERLAAADRPREDELLALLDPAEPVRPLFTPLFWAMAALALLCIAAALLVGFHGAELFPRAGARR